MKKNERNLYLSNIELEKALNLFFDHLKDRINCMETEAINVFEAHGRITGHAVYAKLSSPNFNASAMDGIAVMAKKTFGASEANPIRLKMGQDFIFVDTGDPISDPYDAVIMIEDVVELDNETVEIIKAAAPWQDIRPIGEDIVAHEMIIPAYHKIRPVDVAAMLSGGLTRVEVLKKPRVALIPTGTEIVEPGAEVEKGSIIESNSRMFEGMVLEYGGQPARHRPVADDYELLKQAISKALEESDIVIINAGSSAGSEDFTVKLVEELGEVIAHGIAIKPGKPAILGTIEGKPVLGIPGYPVSAFVVFEAFARPLILKYLNQPLSKKETVEAVVSRRVVSSLKHQEFVRVKLGNVDGKLIATPLQRGAGATMSMVRADGIMTVPQNSEGIESGEEVAVTLLKDLADVNNTIVSIGSHDLAMDIIGSLMHRQNSAYHLSSAHVGSLGGIMALKRGEAHMAPIHLLDEATGVYNIEYIKRYLPNVPIVLIKGIKRIQGMMVKKGNPKQIKGFKDLQRKDIQFVNRQRGAGTRILVDYMLAKENINTSEIIGYERDMTTHMAVAAAVASGSADIGIGVLSAAKAMELDFIPIGEEDYDFAVPVKYLDQPMITLFLDVIRSEAFKRQLSELGGYSMNRIGELIYI